MKKILKIVLLLALILAFGIGYYFIRVKNFEINKNVYVEQKEKLSDFLEDINRPLTMLIISNSIDNEFERESSDLTKSKNLFDNVKYKQQFTMEYYLQKTKNYDDFITVNQLGEKDDEGYVTDEMAVSYLKYDEFNKYYNKLFGSNFNKNNREYSPFRAWDNKDYVYYSNRRSGSNGLFIVSTDIDAILKTGNIYKAKVTLDYNDALKSKISTNTMTLEYKYKNNDIVITSIKFE